MIKNSSKFNQIKIRLFIRNLSNSNKLPELDTIKLSKNNNNIKNNIIKKKDNNKLNNKNLTNNNTVSSSSSSSTSTSSSSSNLKLDKNNNQKSSSNLIKSISNTTLSNTNNKNISSQFYSNENQNYQFLTKLNINNHSNFLSSTTFSSNSTNNLIPSLNLIHNNITNTTTNSTKKWNDIVCSSILALLKQQNLSKNTDILIYLLQQCCENVPPHFNLSSNILYNDHINNNIYDDIKDINNENLNTSSISSSSLNDINLTISNINSNPLYQLNSLINKVLYTVDPKYFGNNLPIFYILLSKLPVFSSPLSSTYLNIYLEETLKIISNKNYYKFLNSLFPSMKKLIFLNSSIEIDENFNFIPYVLTVTSHKNYNFLDEYVATLPESAQETIKNCSSSDYESLEFYYA